MTRSAYLTFFEHLDELRKRMTISLVALLIGTIAGCYYADPSLRLLLQPVAPEIHEFYFFSPTAAFLVKFKIALLLGFLVASPVVISQLWLFVSPGLRGKEKKMVIPLIGVTSILFLLGAFFCFYVVIPFAFKFLIGMRTDYLKPMISIENYMDFLFGMLLGFGVSFNMPVFIMAFVYAGLLNVKMLNRYQRHIIVLIFIVAAVLTPTPDISGQLMLAVPLVVLFELSIIGSWLIERLRKKNRKRASF
jgi:sec-independent protein translocase protein TatC